MAKSSANVTSEKDLAKLLITEPRLFARLADFELKRGNAKAASKIVVKGLQQLPDSVSGWIVKGNLHLSLKQAKLARTAFEKALQFDQDIPFAHRQCAELAAEEGDQEGYLFHLRHLARLESLDENVQTMLQTALLREAAVKNGIYSRESVSRVMPGALRQALLRAGALPPEITRRAERYQFPSENDDEALNGTGRSPGEAEPQGREMLAWESPEAEESIRRPEKETREQRYVRVSWADAVTDEKTPPLVEIGPEQFEPSEEEEILIANQEFAEGATIETTASEVPTANEAEPASSQPPIFSAIRDEGETKPEREPLVKPYVHRPGKLENLAVETEVEARPTIESDWEGATPQPPMVELPKPQPVAPPPVEPQAVKPRFKLPADMVLPERRPLELDGDSPKSPRPMTSASPTPSDPPLPLRQAMPESPQPDMSARFFSPSAPQVVSDPPVVRSSIIRKAELPEPSATPSRDDASIQRLLGTERVKKPIPPKVPISELLTRFEPDESPTNEPPAEPPQHIAPVKIMNLIEEFSGEEAPPPKLETKTKPVVTPPQTVQPLSEPVAKPAVADTTMDEDAPLQKPPEVLAREEEAREKLATIAKEVTGKPVAPAALKAALPKPTTPTPPAPKPAEAKEEGDKGKPKIATKTLAELYASQGDWTRAVEVYEALLEKFPTNEAYKRRLDALRSKMTSN